MRLAAKYGSQWVTVDRRACERTSETILDSAHTQRALLDAACMEVGRDPSSIGKVLLWIPTEPVIESPTQFDELAGPYVDLGFNQFVLHHPAQTGPYAGNVKAFEEIAAVYAAG